MVQYEVIACSASVKGLLHKPRAPIIFCLLRSRSCNKEHNNGELFARALPRYGGKPTTFLFVCHRRCLQPRQENEYEKAGKRMTVSTKKRVSIHVSKSIVVIGFVA